MRTFPLRRLLSLGLTAAATGYIVWGAGPPSALTSGLHAGLHGLHRGMAMGGTSGAMSPLEMRKHLVTAAMREQAAVAAAKQGVRIGARTGMSTAAVVNPAAPPDYFGGVPNYANSPLAVPAAAGGITPGTGIRKFVDSLPGLGPANTNNLGQYLPVAVPDTVTFPGSDYYEIHLVEYSRQLHSDLPPTTLRGYLQTNKGTDAAGNNTVLPAPVQYLGPTIVAQRNRPVRVTFVNTLPTGAGGNLHLPVDTTLMGAGTGPNGGTETYPQNRGNVHLHGGFTPWISDGTPHQWTTPAGQVTTYPKGVSTAYVPDMWFDAAGNLVKAGTPGATNNPGPGAMTFYYTNQQSARLMFYHDHSLGLTRLNVYAGEAAGYLLRDPAEQRLVTAGTIPADELPLIVQDKTFVPDTAQLATEDPTWNPTAWGGKGSLWFPHVYMPNQHPTNATGINPMGRWDYGPWFWPPFTGLAHGPVANPYYDPVNAPWEPPNQPGTPAPSATPEGFMDTPVVNGTAYPFVKVGRKAYRLRILNASNDRTLNLQLYYAASGSTMWNADGTLADGRAGEVPMVPAVATAGFPAAWPTDGRAGGVPDPAARGPKLVQIGTEAGFLPGVAVLDNQPVDYDHNPRSITFGNVTSKTLMLGPAERADVIVDFSQVPDGSKLILYNDAPAPTPFFDTRYDYYTGDPDQRATGGAPTTPAGYGPNTRTVLQFQVSGPAAPAFDVAALTTALPAAYKASQPAPIVPEAAYNASQGTTATNTYGRIADTQLTFTPQGGTAPVTLQLRPKAIVESFDPSYGRMNATLGVELPNTNANVQTTIPLGYAEPATEELRPSDLGTPVGTLADGTQLWKLTHNGVDTHTIHSHLFELQLINRVGWDNSLRPPDANEVGWKESVRMNPLEDVILATRPTVPTLPFKIGDSRRPIDPTMPANATITTFDPQTGAALTVTNEVRNYGWEYVWHCHLLGHEENDMMRPVRFIASPAAPTGLTAAARTAPAPAGVVLTWTNASAAPTAATNFVVQRATSPDFTTGLVTTDLTPAGTATTWTDTTTAPATAYYYRVRAETASAYSEWAPSASALTP